MKVMAWLAVGMLLATCSASPGTPTPSETSATAHSVPGAGDDVRHSDNMRVVASLLPTPPFDGPETWGTDIAFQENYAFVGNYEGFTVYDIGEPEKLTAIARVVCPAAQNDVAVYGKFLFVSVDEPRSGDRCESGAADPSADTAWAGIRIFDISDVRKPRYVKSVRTACGSHTATLVPDVSKQVIYLYVSSTDSCVTPQGAISIVEVPLANVQDAQVVATPSLSQKGKASGVTACHDITAYPEKKLAAGACYDQGILLDISDPVRPEVVQQISDPENFSVWHSATFNNDGTKVVFSDEMGGGTQPTCTSSTPANQGANAIYELTKTRKLVRHGLYKIPRMQADTENCVAHNGSLVPVPGKDVMVQAWYQGGVSVWDFTDSDHPSELAYFDRGPVGSIDELGGSWSAYYYNGYIYSSDLTKGLDVLRLDDSRTDSAERIQITRLNAQTQQSY